MSLRRGVSALFLVVVLFASGCVAPGSEVEPAAALPPAASTERFDLDALLVERLSLRLTDGVALDVAVFRPDVEKAGAPDEKVPILADIGPYFGNLAGPMMELTGFDERLAEYFVPRGYAIARVSLRGTGDSEGCFRVGDQQEQQDVHDAVEFLASQPWSNGNVAVIGKSYDGTTPWMAAITNPTGLRTVVPISGLSDMYRYTFYDGVAYEDTTGFHTYYPAVVDYDAPVWSQPSADHLRANLVRTCADIVQDSLDAGMTYLDGDHGTAFWQARDYEPRMKDVKVPVFLVHGLQDWNVDPDNSVPQYAKLDVPKAMWLGQWEHDYPDINRHNEEWSRHDWNATLLTWFDHWLKDVPNDWERLAHVEVQDHLGTWRNYTAWPPAEAAPLRLFLQEDGALSAAPGDAGSLWFSDPLGQGHEPGAAKGGLTFLGGPVASNVTLVGAPTVDLHLVVDRAAGHVVVRLWDVDEAGKWTEIAHGARSLRHRETRDHGSDVPTGQAFNLTVHLYPQESTLRAGHRLGITVAAESPGLYRVSPHRLATYEVLLGGDAASAVDLLVATATQAPVLRDAAQADAATARATCGATCPSLEIVK